VHLKRPVEHIALGATGLRVLASGFERFLRALGGLRNDDISSGFQFRCKLLNDFIDFCLTCMMVQTLDW